MIDTKIRFIESAVRPLADNAELQLAAARFLESGLEGDDIQREQAITRWDELDARRRPPVWRITLATVLLAVSAIVLVPGISEVKKLGVLSNILSAMGGGPAASGPVAAPAGKKSLTEDERLILYGDESQSSKTGKAKGIWDRYPDNPAYFSQYVEAHLSEHQELPDDFLANARRLDPENAWFLYLAAGVEGRDSVKKKEQSSKAKAAHEPPEWEILDTVRLENAVRLVHEASHLKSCTDYKFDLLREKIPLLAQGDKFEWTGAVAHLAGMTSFDIIAMRKVGDVISAQAGLLGSAKDADSFRELMADSDAFAHKILSVEPSNLVAGLVYRVNIAAVCHGLAGGAMALDLHPEAERYQKIYDRMFEVRKSLKDRALLIDGVGFEKKAAYLAAMTVPMVNRQVKEPPAVTDGVLKPARLMEHEFVSRVCAVVVFFFLGICLGLVWVSRFFRRALIQRLATRFESLMRPVDWMWMVGAGVIPPLLFVMVVNRLTPLGGRDLSVFWLEGRLPVSHFLGLASLWLTLPILVARWRVDARCGGFGFVRRRAWVGWLAVGSGFIYIIMIGYAARSGVDGWVRTASVILLISCLWPVFLTCLTFFAKPARSLLSATIARMLVPTYACAMLLVICLVPVFKAGEEYWFRHDHFMRLDPQYPGMTAYEYKVSVRLQEETREQLDNSH